MNQVLDYCDAINLENRKGTHTWEIIEDKFRRIPHQSYMVSFRNYMEKGVTETQNICWMIMCTTTLSELGIICIQFTTRI